ncbi:MAG: carboxy terminal-processing peptidase [Gammaproteobacteria bacterium]
MRTVTIVFGLSLGLGSLFTAASVGAKPAPVTQASSPAPASAETVAVAPATLLVPKARQVLIGRTVTQVIQAHHYPDKKLDTEFSHAALKQYFDSLDPNRFYFTQPAIERFRNAYQEKLAGDLKQGNLKPAFAIYDYYIKQANRQLHYALGLLAEKPDFNGDQSFEFSRRHAHWAQNEKALNKIWRERVDNDILSLLLDGKSWKNTQQTLTGRYRHALNHVNRTTSNDVFDAYTNSFAQTEDPHSSYFSPFDAQQFKIEMSLQLQGVGAQLSESDNYVTVVRVIPGGPAAKSKALKAGDRIVGVGEGKNGKIKDVIGWRLDDVVKMIRGRKGSTVRLRILPAGALPGSGERTIALVRNTIELDAEHAHASIALVKQGSVAYKIGIITIPSFYLNFKAEGDGHRHYASVSHDVAALIKILKQKKVSGILLDLRNNGGGSLQEATALTGLFIPSGPVVQVQERSGRSQSLPTPQGEPTLWRGPLALIVNRFSASATEIFAGAMKDYHRALILGSRTWGKGTVQQLIQLDGFLPGFKAGELKLTTAQFYRVNGSSTQHRGVKPDIAFPSAINDNKFGESSYPNALPWKEIPAADYRPVQDGLDKALPKIKNYYTDTVMKRPRFQLYLRETSALRAQAARTHISLNYQARKTERVQRRAHELALDNAWRELLGKKPFKSLKADNDAKFSPPDVVLAASANLLGKYIAIAPALSAKFKSRIHTISRTGKTSPCLHKLNSGNPLVQICPSSKNESKDEIIYPPSARTNGSGDK